VTLLDTTFLIDLQRGERNPSRHAAESWLEGHQNEELAIPAIVFGEFSEGFEDSDHPALIRYKSGFPIIPVDDAVATFYGRISRMLRADGKLIGSNDTWIAATALSLSCPLLTRNADHFSRVPNLVVATYGS
jgi:predicted nucleic acid-binding protein